MTRTTRNGCRRLVLAGLTALVALALTRAAAAGPESGPHAPPWGSDATARLAALALLETLNAELLSHDSATLTLDRWCNAHHLASPAVVVAERDRTARRTASAEQRQLLRVSATEPVRYRRVKLKCGSHVLSEADNWYVPSRLTPDMNHRLDTTDVPFGRTVQALHFQRRTLSARLLWSPLPDGWEMKGAAAFETTSKTLQIPHAVLEHRAVLTLADGTPFSTVVETYTREVLAFPQPRLPLR